jgi:hypothetical protein
MCTHVKFKIQEKTQFLFSDYIHDKTSLAEKTHVGSYFSVKV